MADRKVSFGLNLFDSPYSEFSDDLKVGSVLALQNLKQFGFEEAEGKKKGLSLRYARLALEELARFHAVGYAFLNSYPGGAREGFEKNKVGPKVKVPFLLPVSVFFLAKSNYLLPHLTHLSRPIAAQPYRLPVRGDQRGD